MYRHSGKLTERIHVNSCLPPQAEAVCDLHEILVHACYSSTGTLTQLALHFTELR